MTLSKAEKVGFTPVYWKFNVASFFLHLMSQNICKITGIVYTTKLYNTTEANPVIVNFTN